MANEKLVARVGADIRGFRSGMQRSVDIAKRSAKRIVLAFTGVMVASAMVGSKFEKEIMKTATVAQAFGKDLEALENKAREIGKSTAFHASEAAKGMYDLASAGLNTREIIDTIEHAMVLAGATATDITQSTQILSATMRQFGVDASESKRFVDTFAGAITNSLLTMNRLTESMKYAGTVGSSFGWSIEETTAAVAQFVNLGLEGSMAGTNLRMAMLGLIKGTDKARDALTEMGLTLKEVSPETYNFGEIIKTLGKHFMTSEQAVAIFGARSAMNMKRLSELSREGKIDYEGFVQMLIDAQEGAGRASKMYERLMSTFWASMKIFWSAIKELGLVIFNFYREDATKAFNFLTKQVNRLSDTLKEHQHAYKTFFLEMQISGVKAVRSIIGIVGHLSAVWAYMWENIKTTFGYEWFEEHIIEPLKISYGWLKDRFGVAWEYYFGPEGMVPTASKFYLETGTEEARRAYEQRLKDFKEFGEKLKVTQDEIEKKLLEHRRTLPVTGIPSGKGKPKPIKGGISFPRAPKSVQDEDVKEFVDWNVKIAEERLDIIRNFYKVQEEMGKTHHQIRMKLIDEEAEAYIDAGITDTEAYKWAEKAKTKIKKEQTQARLSIIAGEFGRVAETARTISDLTKGQSKKAWQIYKAFAIAEATVTGIKSIMSSFAEGSKFGGPVAGYAFAGIAAAFTAAQIAAIKSAQPPSYDEGGISTSPGMYYSGVPEAHIPLKKGKVPVEMKGGGPTVVIQMNNPRFQDLNAQRRTFRIIAEEVTRRVAPVAVYNDYHNDGRIRRMVRSK